MKARKEKWIEMLLGIWYKGFQLFSGGTSGSRKLKEELCYNYLEM